MLKTILDLPLEVRANWEVVLYEQRRDVGGIWLPDSSPIHPPVLPETPLYPMLHTNTPIPTMTYPGFPFPPGTPLFSIHDPVERYHRDYATRFNLWPYISLNHTVLSSSWVGRPDAGYWDVIVEDHNGNEIQRSFDHLVVANGHNHEPHIPVFPGQEVWLANKSRGRREILHTIWYRDPAKYTNQTVVVVGGGASGSDISSQVSLYARKVYQTIRSSGYAPSGPVEIKPEISYFTADEIVLVDGSTLQEVDVVLLGTGYDLRIPFLEHSREVVVKPGSNETEGKGLTTNLRYLFPLHQHIFSLSHSYPTNALAFIGLPVLIANCPSDLAQSIYVAHIIANGSLLEPRAELLGQLEAHEQDLRQRGYDPYYIGHRMVDNSAFDYQDGLIRTLRTKGALPQSETNYVEAWRREAREYQYLKRGWERIEELGQEDKWLEGVESEDEWANLMRQVDIWQRDWEAENGSVFPEDALQY
ncbi:hypothetical protein ID866_9433 [Astraeus odoratus]|nr:hypothetical protein ID866_9433 [Astraeus odoratus]